MGQLTQQGPLEPYVKAISEHFTPERCRELVGPSQIAIYVMAGGGMVGRLYAEQPKDAYLDNRARAPYSVQNLERARLILVALAERAGLDPHAMPAMPRFHNLGVF